MRGRLSRRAVSLVAALSAVALAIPAGAPSASAQVLESRAAASDFGKAPNERSGKKKRPLALVYRGPASCAGCSEAAARLVKASKFKFRVAYVGPREKRKITAGNLRKARLYVQPGGDTSVAKADRLLGNRAKKLIKNYVRAGGHYLGICQGAYLAGANPGMAMLAPADSGQYIQTPGASVTSTRDAVIPVRWGANPRTAKTYRMFFQDGPYFTLNSVRGVKVFARYTNGRIAAMTKTYGKGRVGVVGPHPEAPRSWYRAIGQKDRSAVGRALGKRLINATMKR